MRVIRHFVLASVLTGCVMVAPPAPNPPQPASCGARSLQNLVGLSVRVLPPQGQWSAVRIIRPGDMVTMDYSPSRLNVRVNMADRILELTCG